MGQFIFRRNAASPQEFVNYWSAAYDYDKQDDDEIYLANIKPPLTARALRALFCWKMGPRFLKNHLPRIERDFISRTRDAQEICATASAEEFLNTFRDGGPIYRIFWAHCWQPNRFPIYDQHVHRAMTFIVEGMREELTEMHKTEKAKIEQYITRYLPFNKSRFAGISQRDVDRALWKFGSFIKSPSVPIE